MGYFAAVLTLMSALAAWAMYEVTNELYINV